MEKALYLRQKSYNIINLFDFGNLFFVISLLIVFGIIFILIFGLIFLAAHLFSIISLLAI